jgi:DNA-directed RNA polymerase specialized sigma24 family protein
VLDDAIAALARYSPEHSRVVELRFGLGLTVEEAARTTGMAERTIKRRWHVARAWLYDYLTQHDAQPAG